MIGAGIPTLPNYCRCVRCVMDTTDPGISFDENGVCNHCRSFPAMAARQWFPDSIGASQLRAWVARIKSENQGKDYDCVLGVSGGADSAYLAYKTQQLGLRPLLVHVDTGWNSELAVKNIESLARNLDLDLQTEVIDWEEMKDLQLAMLRSGVASQDAPQDHAIFGTLYHITISYGIKYLISGLNFSTECINVCNWGYDVLDSLHLRALHRQFGRGTPLSSFPLLSFKEYCTYRFGFPPEDGIVTIPFLNFLPYNKAEAIELLASEIGFRDYESKHYESRFTKFFQGYYLPMRLGIDKRIIHYSSLILTGQMSRDEALARLQSLPYDPNAIEEEVEYVRKKLDIPRDEFDLLLKIPVISHRDYPNNEDRAKEVANIAAHYRAAMDQWERVSANADLL